MGIIKLNQAVLASKLQKGNNFMHSRLGVNKRIPDVVRGMLQVFSILIFMLYLNPVLPFILLHLL